MWNQLMNAIEPYLNPKTQPEKVQLVFVVSSCCSMMVFSAIAPFIIPYSLLALSTYFLVNSFSDWQHTHEVNLTEAELAAKRPEGVTKVIIAAIAVALGIYLSFSSTLMQILVSTTLSTGLSLFFAEYVVLASQLKLDKALRDAVSNGEKDIVAELLKRGADPFALDENENTAFHLAVNDKADAVEILKVLTQNLEQASLAPRSVLTPLKGLSEPQIRAKVIACWEPLKNVIKDFSEKTRSDFSKAISELWAEMLPSFKASVNTLSALIRQSAAASKDLQRKNKGEQTPKQLFESLKNQFSTTNSQNMEAALIEAERKSAAWLEQHANAATPSPAANGSSTSEAPQPEAATAPNPAFTPMQDSQQQPITDDSPSSDANVTIKKETPSPT